MTELLTDDLRFVATDGPVIGSLCTGYGGLDLGVAAVLGGRIAWYCEVDPHAAAILAARLPGVPNLGDLRTTDFSVVERIEVLTAGFPCQDISAAGPARGHREGSAQWAVEEHPGRHSRTTTGPRHRGERFRAPVENGGVDVVLGGLAEAGYDAVWRCVRAADIGAAHRRERLFLCAVPGAGRDADDADPAGP